MGEVGYPESVVVGSRGVDGPPTGPRETARMAGFILNAVNPSVNASGMSRCRRHERGVSKSEFYPGLAVFGFRG